MTDLVKDKELRANFATSFQRKASDPLSSVWVEASAGTGKTKVLSDRVLRLLLNGVNPTRILCLTYTKAAAVEMNTRIAGRLSRWAVLDDDNLHKELFDLMGSLPKSRSSYEDLCAAARRLFAVLLDMPTGMKIQTIHSFCQDILKRFPLEAKISPYFEVMDERSAFEIIGEIKSKILKTKDERIETALAYLVANAGEFKFADIMNSLAFNRNKIGALLEKHENLEQDLASSLGINATDTKDNLISNFVAMRDKDMLQKMVQALGGGLKTDLEKAERITLMLLDDNYEQYRFAFVKPSDGKPYAKFATNAVVKIYPNIIEDMGREAVEVEELENKLKAIDVFASTKAVLQIAEVFIREYKHYKAIHSKMDYEDLIVITRSLLENKAVADWVLFKLDGGIDHVLIDEAQDTSPDQWAIVKAVAGDFFAGQGAIKRPRTMFVVGDRKQSIYSFQGADVVKFMEVKEHFSEHLEEVKMDVSFRSVDAILDAVNVVFAEEKPHVPYRIGDGGRVEIWPIIEPEEGENVNQYQPPVERVSLPTTSLRLAREIASKIKEAVSSGEMLASQGRAVRYKDFLVLVQRRNSFVEELVRECKNIGVSVAGVDKIKLLEQIAVQDLISLGKFLLLPNDDLSLAEVLKSPLFGLDDDDLFGLCYDRRGASLWVRLGDNSKYVQVFKQLHKLLNMADFVRPFELYSYVLNVMQGRKKFVERMGLDVEDGLDEFVNLLINFEGEHIPSLQNFIAFVEKDKIELKRELEQSDVDAVRIMTVHGSKGLQAPIVILPDTIRVPQTSKKADILWDDLLYYPLSSQCFERKCQSIHDKKACATMEEYRRLLYVALTRAEDRLVVCGYRKGNKARDEAWYNEVKSKVSAIASEDGGKVLYETSQRIEPKASKVTLEKEFSMPEFSWLSEKAEVEMPLAKPYQPSKPEEEEVFASPLSENNEARFLRGKIIHKILQFAPNIKGDKRAVIEDFLQKNARELSESAKRRIADEVLSLLNDERFSAVFSENSKAETAIMGEVDGKIISAQIDRLVVEEGRVLIVDYKTNRPAAVSKDDVPQIYVQQMASYKKLLENIYPNKIVQTLILWTDTGLLMEI